MSINKTPRQVYLPIIKKLMKTTKLKHLTLHQIALLICAVPAYSKVVGNSGRKVNSELMIESMRGMIRRMSKDEMLSIGFKVIKNKTKKGSIVSNKILISPANKD